MKYTLFATGLNIATLTTPGPDDAFASLLATLQSRGDTIGGVQYTSKRAGGNIGMNAGIATIFLGWAPSRGVPGQNAQVAALPLEDAWTFTLYAEGAESARSVFETAVARLYATGHVLKASWYGEDA